MFSFLFFSSNQARSVSKPTALVPQRAKFRTSLSPRRRRSPSQRWPRRACTAGALTSRPKMDQELREISPVQRTRILTCSLRARYSREQKKPGQNGASLSFAFLSSSSPLCTKAVRIGPLVRLLLLTDARGAYRNVLVSGSPAQREIKGHDVCRQSANKEARSKYDPAKSRIPNSISTSRRRD